MCEVHVWRLVSMVCAADGTTIEVVCARCGAVSLESPDDLAGRSGG